MEFEGIGVIDLMIGFPTSDVDERFGFLGPLLDDRTSTPTAYLFPHSPGYDSDVDPVTVTLREMDRHGIAVGLISTTGSAGQRALREYPTRFVACVDIDPSRPGEAVRRIRHGNDEFGIVAASTFPAGCHPQADVDDRRYYPVYEACVDLDIPIIVNAGIAGPRVPSDVQNVLGFDRVCYDFPELRIVMRHGAEPWEDLAVNLMLKWPGLHYMTSAFAPKHYPSAIVDFVNDRGRDKVLYAGYFPMGLSLDRIFAELPHAGIVPEAWPGFLRDNACRVFKLAERLPG